MRVRNNVIYSLILIATDILALLVAFTLAYILRVQYDARPLVNEIYAQEYMLTFFAVVPLWLLIFASLGLYDRNIQNKKSSEVFKLFVGSFIGILIVIGYSFVIDQDVFPARLVAVYAFIGSFILLVVSRYIIHFSRKWAFRQGFGAHRILIIGNSTTAKDIIHQIDISSSAGYHISAIAGPKKIVPSESDAVHYSSVNRALKIIDSLKITAIIQTDLFEDEAKNQDILAAAQSRHIDYSFIPAQAEFYAGKNTVDVFLSYPIISISQTPLIGWGEVAKRIIDLIITLPLVLILALPLLLILLLQKLFNPGPVFYKSTRLSRYSEKITVYKFRSMNPAYGKKDAAEEFRDMGREDLAKEYEAERKVSNDPRITRFGQFLRITSLDELPQLFNVLKGDLSLVGPRPILPQEMKLVKGKGALLHSVKSGVTGLWQVSGRSELNFDQRIELETYYAQNWSLWLDIKILFKTILVVVKRSGAK